MDQPEPTKRPVIQLSISGLSRRQLIIGLTGAACSIAIAIITIIIIHPHLTPKGSAFSNAQLAQITGFKPYYLKPGTSTDFKIQKSTINYQSGVLVFALKNPAGKTLAFTEEAIPPNFEPSQVATQKTVTTEYGQGYINDAPDRTSGTLFTSDHTWIVINAPDPIGADTMQQILSALTPVTH